MANENMIQKHVDNFLAKIVGETPVDDKPRNSTEFWLNEIAENLPGGGATIYRHSITGYRDVTATKLRFTLDIFNTNATAFATTGEIAKYLYDNGYIDEQHMIEVSGAYNVNVPQYGVACGAYSEDGVNFKTVIFNLTNQLYSSFTNFGTDSTFTDIVTAIN